jgi:hypothetical protein
MANHADDQNTIRDDLVHRATRLRALAAQARKLAREIRDRLASAGLEKHALELEREAEHVAAQLATLAGARLAMNAENIAALKPPAEQPPAAKPSAERAKPHGDNRKRRR